MFLTSLLRHFPNLSLRSNRVWLHAGIGAAFFAVFATQSPIRAQEADFTQQLSAAAGVATEDERAAGLRRFTDRAGLSRIQRPESQSVILEVRVDGKALDGEFIFGYRREDGMVLVGLGGLSDLLSFSIQVDPDSGVAEGWFLSEDRNFTLSLGAGSLVMSGERLPFPDDGIELHDDDIYVGLDTLQKWFPIDVSADLMRMALFIKPRELLPFQKAQQREALAGQLSGSSSNIFAGQNSMRIPYQWVAAPVFNVTASGSVSKSGDTTSKFGTVSVQSEGDLLGFSSSLNALVSYRDDKLDLDTFDILLERDDPSGGLLGPLKATNIALGDVLMPSVPLLSTVRRGRGAYISNISSNRVSQADDFVLVGTVPPDWDVELYQDDRLLSIQTVSSDGRYEFSTLSLRPGSNEFRIVAYGPNGETDERTERVFLGPGLQSSGTLAYELGAVQSSDALITLGEQALPDEPGFVGRFEYGVSDMFSLVAGGVYGTVGKRTGEGALFAGARASLGGYYTAIDASMEEGGSFALSNEVRTSFKELDAFISHIQRFNPRLNETEIQSETVLGVGHRPFELGALRLGQRLEFSRQNKFDRSTAYVADHQFAVSWKRWNASHSVNVQWFADPTLSTSVGGTVSVRGQASDIRYRLQADYSPTQGDLIQGVSLQARRRFGRDITATVDVDREFSGGTTTVGLDLSWRFDKFSIGIAPAVDTKGNYVFGLNLRTTLLPQDRALKYRFAGAEERNGATILGVRVFVDQNANGEFDSDETVLPDIVVSGTRKRAEGMTNEEGIAWVPNLMPGPQTIVTIDQRTLPDVTYRPARAHLVVQTRPGVLPVINYPILVLGEVDGFVVEDDTVDMLDFDPVAGVRVQLVNAAGVVIAQTRSEFDGYYYFSDLELGDYQVVLAGRSSGVASDGNDLAESSTVSTEPAETRNISLTAAEPFVADLNFSVVPR